MYLIKDRAEDSRGMEFVKNNDVIHRMRQY